MPSPSRAAGFRRSARRRDVMTFRGPKTEIVDVKGATVLPGFVEPHMHFIYEIVTGEHACRRLSANALRSTRFSRRSKVDSAKYRPAMVRRIRIRQLRHGAVSAAHGARTSTAYRPMCRSSSINPSGHIGYANSKAFAIVGVTAHSPDVAGGGHYGKDSSGALERRIYEPPAMQPFIEKTLASIAPTTGKDYGLVWRLLAEGAAAGVTTVTRRRHRAHRKSPRRLGDLHVAGQSFRQPCAHQHDAGFPRTRYLRRVGGRHETRRRASRSFWRTASFRFPA